MLFSSFLLICLKKNKYSFIFNSMERKEIVNILEYYQELGMDEFVNNEPNPWIKSETINIVQPVNTRTERNEKNLYAESISISPKQAVNSAKDLTEKANTINELEDMIRNFNGCSLKKNCINTVVGEGVENPNLMIIGEAPGGDEDRIGKPFVGKAGKLLDKMLESIGFSREKNTYISNVLYWRPPGNRTPTTEEILICKPFVEKMISLLSPKIIVFTGGSSAANMLNTTSGITKIRGKIFEYLNGAENKTYQTIPIFHPAFLLRNPAMKKITWQDLIKINKLINS
jgi:DNA polymerase